jgi:hypothetical protein
MSVILFILGSLVAAAGIVAIGFGIPINEFNLGNTLIVSGTTAFAAGIILIGLAAAVDQLIQIAQALRPRSARPASQPQATEPVLAGAVRLGQVPGQVPGPTAGPVPVPAKAVMPTPPRGPVFARPKGEELAPEPASAESAAEVSSSAIERLRSSLERPGQKAGDPSEAEDVYAAPAGGPRTGANGAAPARGTPAGNAAAVEAPKKPPLDFFFRSKARESQPEAFDAVWPRRGQRRSGGSADADEPAAAEAPSDRSHRSNTPPASESDELRPPAILKSGVVDGMAYTLYADGSIEAQLPQGTVRFGSIAELRSHIENNS